MSQNMPLLSRVLGTAALTSVIVVLLMSYQWGRAAEPPVTQVIRLHPKWSPATAETRRSLEQLPKTSTWKRPRALLEELVT